MRRASDNCAETRDTSSSYPIQNQDVEGLQIAPPTGDEAPPTNLVPALVSRPAILPVVDVQELDWGAIRKAVDAPAIRARIRSIVERMESVLERAGGPGMLFDGDRGDASNRAIQVADVNAADPFWIIGDLHGDLLALEAALALIRYRASTERGSSSRGSSSSGTSSTTRVLDSQLFFAFSS